MNYELALKLKEAGFPQHDRVSLYYLGPDRVGYLTAFQDTRTPDGMVVSNEGLIKLVTLEELIEACGDNFGSLEHTDSVPRWHAVKFPLNLGFHSDTPTEAVANLWLALNVKT